MYIYIYIERERERERASRNVVISIPDVDGVTELPQGDDAGCIHIPRGGDAWRVEQSRAMAGRGAVFVVLFFLYAACGEAHSCFFVPKLGGGRVRVVVV